eukprot:scaffold35469_cov94-Isochrysis_galbana.AAC.1
MHTLRDPGGRACSFATKAANCSKSSPAAPSVSAWAKALRMPCFTCGRGGSEGAGEKRRSRRGRWRRARRTTRGGVRGAGWSACGVRGDITKDNPGGRVRPASRVRLTWTPIVRSALTNSLGATRPA